MLSKRIEIASRALSLTVTHHPPSCARTFSLISLHYFYYNFYSCYTLQCIPLPERTYNSVQLRRIQLQLASRTKVHHSLRPPVGAVLIRTHVIQSHLLLSPSSLRLEKYGFSVIALRAWMFLGSRQRRIRYHVGDDVR